MILDKFSTFFANLLYSSMPSFGATGALVGDVIDTGSAPTLKNLGISDGLWLVINVITTCTGATNTTRFALCSDSTANLATSKTIHVSTPDIPVASLVAGYKFAVKLPANADYERYVGIWATTLVASLTAGAFTASLTQTLPTDLVTYPDAVN